MSERQPIFNVPGVVVAILGVFVLVHLGRDLLSEAAEDQLMDMLVFSRLRLGPGAGDLPGGHVAGVTQFVTHLFLHADLTHLLINSAWFLAFATPIARRLGSLRFLAFFLVCGIGGALLYLPFNLAPMVGASGAISGLMGASLRFLFLPMNDGDRGALSGASHPPLLSLSQSLTDRRILIAIVGWTLFNIIAAYGFEAVMQERGIAWEAHLGGFFTGFLTFGLFDPRRPAAA